MSHATPWRSGAPGDEADHRLFHIGFDPGGGFLFCAAADLANQDDRVGVGVGIEELEDVDEVAAGDGVAADADAGGLPDGKLGELADGLIGQGARLRDHADVARLVDVAGHDAHLGLTRGNHTRAVWANQTCFCLRHQNPFHLHHIEHRNSLGDGDDQLDPCANGFENGIGGEGRRHVDNARVGLRCIDRIGDGVEDRQFFAGVLEELAALAGSDPTDHLGAVFNHLLRVKGAGFTGNPLNDGAGIFVEQDGHLRPLLFRSSGLELTRFTPRVGNAFKRNQGVLLPWQRGNHQRSTVAGRVSKVAMG